MPESRTTSLFPGKNTIAICGNQPDLIRSALEMNVNCLILCRTELPKEFYNIPTTTCIIATPYDAYRTSRLIFQSTPIGRICRTEDLTCFHLEDRVDEVKELVLKHRESCYPILDANDKVVGILRFCEGQRLKPIFIAVSSDTMYIMQELGLSVMKCGEEAVLDLSDYTLAGGSRAVLRRSVNKGDKSGVTLQEYCPQKKRDFALETEIMELSRKWYEDKERQINFAVGSIDFEHPYDRRFFITRDAEGTMLVFLSFLPYDHGKKLCIDLMHRKMDAPTGSMEHAIISVARAVREEGIAEISLNFAPLAGIGTGETGMTIVERLLNAIFQKMDAGYHFKKLYQFKKKFDPSIWEPRYIVYHRRISKIDLAMTVSNTMLGSVDLLLYARYKFFLIGELFKIKWEFITRGKNRRSL